MAEKELILRVDEALAERLRSAAGAVGESVETYARRALEAFAEDGGTWISEDWEEDLKALEEYDRNGVGRPADEVMAEFRASIVRRFNKRG